VVVAGRTVTAIEDSPDWHAYVVRSLASRSNAEVHLATDHESHANLPLTWDRSFDVVVVDGGDRLACLGPLVWRPWTTSVFYRSGNNCFQI
jgi:hypothetical protein